MPPTENPPVSLLARFLQWWIPSPCLGCGETVWEPHTSLGLCVRCRGRLRRWPETACPGCGRPLGAAPADGFCAACRAVRATPILSTWAYEPPLDEVIMGLKFRRLDYLGAQLGRVMAQVHRPGLAEREVVLPVPLHWRRRLTRGYNQAELLARPLADALGLPLVRGLARRRSTRPQSRLEREARARNPAGVFAPRRAALWRGRRVLLVDDVVTTGATLNAAAQTLLEAGARDVVALTAARTAARTARRG